MNPTTVFGVTQWLAQLRRLEQEARCKCPDFLRPHHFVTLAVTLSREGPQEIGLPSALEGYAARMQLWQAIGLVPPVGINEHDPRGRFVPLVRLDDRENVGETADQLANITATFGADPQTTDAVKVSMMEIMDNCFAHAAVSHPLKGVACAQSWPNGNLVQLAIADRGIGIRHSLFENPDLRAELDAGNSCEIATRFGVTSKPGMGHAGYGLALTRQLLERAGGRLIVVSGNEWMQAHGIRCSTGTLGHPWQGTLAVLEWNVDRPLRLKDVYESWPLPTGFDNDDFDF